MSDLTDSGWSSAAVRNRKQIFLTPTLCLVLILLLCLWKGSLIFCQIQFLFSVDSALISAC